MALESFFSRYRDRLRFVRVFDVSIGDSLERVVSPLSVRVRPHKDLSRLVTTDRGFPRLSRSEYSWQEVDGASLPQFGRVVLLGNAGSGKTTLLRLLASRGSNATAGTAALFVSLPSICRTVEHLPAGTLLDLLISEFRLRWGLDEDQVAVFSMVLAQNNGGSAVLLLDGLDEVAMGPDSQGALTTFFRLLEEHLRSHGKTRVVLSSRATAYFNWRERVLAALATGIEPEPVRLAEALPLSEEQWQALVVTLLSAAAEPRATCNVAIARIRETPSLREAATNPLMLTCMALLLREDPNAVLPMTRYELIAETASRLLFDWNIQGDRHRGWRLPSAVGLDVHRDRSDLRARLADALGAQVHLRRLDARPDSRPARSFTFCRTELDQAHVRDEVIHALLRGSTPEPATIEKIVDAFWADLTQQAGIFSQDGVDTGIFRFTHKLFEEYFGSRGAVRHMCRSADLTREVEAWVASAVRNSEEDLIPLLAAGVRSEVGILTLVVREVALLAQGADAEKAALLWAVAGDCLRESGLYEETSADQSDLVDSVGRGVLGCLRCRATSGYDEGASHVVERLCRHLVGAGERSEGVKRTAVEWLNGVTGPLVGPGARVAAETFLGCLLEAGAITWAPDLLNILKRGNHELAMATRLARTLAGVLPAAQAQAAMATVATSSKDSVAALAAVDASQAFGYAAKEIYLAAFRNGATLVSDVAFRNLFALLEPQAGELEAFLLDLVTSGHEIGLRLAAQELAVRARPGGAWDTSGAPPSGGVTGLLENVQKALNACPESEGKRLLAPVVAGLLSRPHSTNLEPPREE